jgi:methionyl-tRNA formyltransferase
MILFLKGERGLSCLKEIIINKIIISIIIIQSKESKKLKLDFFKICKKYNIKIKTVKNINSKTNEIFLNKINTDLFVLIGFSQILKENILKIPKLATVNLHAGKVPKYRGGSPLNWQIINDEKKIYLTILLANSKIDQGDILMEKSFILKKNYTILDVQKRVLYLFPKMIVAVLKKFNKFYSLRVKQPFSSSYFKQRKAKDGIINFKIMKANLIYNTVRALTPPLYPGAFFIYKKRKYILHSVDIYKNYKNDNCNPGDLIILNNKAICFMTKDVPIIIKSIYFKNKIVSPTKVIF